MYPDGISVCGADPVLHAEYMQYVLGTAISFEEWRQKYYPTPEEKNSGHRKGRNLEPLE